MKIRIPPEVIYLNVGDVDEDCDFADLSEVTWCADKIHDSDIEYRLVKRSRKPPGTQL